MWYKLGFLVGKLAFRLGFNCDPYPITIFKTGMRDGHACAWLEYQLEPSLNICGHPVSEVVCNGDEPHCTCHCRQCGCEDSEEGDENE